MTYLMCSYALMAVICVVELLRLRKTPKKDDGYIAAIAIAFVLSPISVLLVVPIIMCDYLYNLFLWIAKSH